MRNIRHVKCMIVGDSGVGKTCLLMRYAINRFPVEHIPTVFDNYTVNIYADGKEIMLQFHDTAEQEDYDRLRVLAYPGTDVFVVCFSVVNPASFRHVKERWIPELRHHCSTARIILMGTQTDQRDNDKILSTLSDQKQKPVTVAAGIKMARKLRMSQYMECSAFTGAGLTSAFNQAVLNASQRNPTTCCLRENKLSKLKACISGIKCRT